MDYDVLNFCIAGGALYLGDTKSASMAPDADGKYAVHREEYVGFGKPIRVSDNVGLTEAQARSLCEKFMSNDSREV